MIVTDLFGVSKGWGIRGRVCVGGGGVMTYLELVKIWCKHILGGGRGGGGV